MAAFDIFIEETLHGNTNTRANNVAVDCPFCGRKEKLWIHRQSGLCQCFGPDCNYRGNAVKIVMDTEQIPYDQAFLQVAQAFRNQVHYTLNNAEAKNIDFCETILRALLKDQKEILEEKHKVRPPKGIGPIKGTLGARYLLSRGFNPAYYQRYKLRFCGKLHAEKRFANHIVFPDYMPGTSKLRYWTTRAAYEPKYGPKSRNPENISRSGVLYGESEAQHAQNSGTIILVEGPMDVLALRGHAVALLGKVLHPEQAMRIIAQYRSVIVCLDRSAGKDVLPVVEQLRSFGLRRCYISHANEDDPAEAVRKGVDDVWGTVKANARPAKTKTLMLAKMHGYA